MSMVPPQNYAQYPKLLSRVDYILVSMISRRTSWHPYLRGLQVSTRFAFGGRVLLLAINDGDNKPVWPTWAVGALLRGARRIIHINCVCFHIPSSSLRSRGILIKGTRKHPVAGFR